MTFLTMIAGQLTGRIPSEIGAMAALEVLSLRYNGLTGSIPSQLGRLTNLFAALALSSNRLIGTIPRELSRLTQLARIWLWDNGLTGQLPSELGLLSSSLSSILVAGNQLNGTIPEELAGLVAPPSIVTATSDESIMLNGSLMEFDVTGNQFLAGTIPPSLCDLSLSCPPGGFILDKYKMLAPAGFACRGLVFDCFSGTGGSSLCGCNCSCT